MTWFNIRETLVRFSCFVAFGFGAGFSKYAPGTCGTLVALPLYGLMAPLSVRDYGLILFVAIGIGIWLCGIAERKTGIIDNPSIVWDEICGYLLTLWGVPKSWFWIAVGFIAFRLFDIWKPWPIYWLDKRVKGGLGIMLDDIIAAGYAWLVLYSLRA
jgi:phosphatidylglycerophosphatase A